MFRVLKKDPTRFSISRSESIPIDDIFLLQGDGNYTWLYATPLKGPLLMSLTLKFMEMQLPHLVRVHKSYVVNVNRVIVVELLSNRCGILKVKGMNQEIPISRTRLEDLLTQLRARYPEGAAPILHRPKRESAISKPMPPSANWKEIQRSRRKGSVPQAAVVAPRL